MSLGLSTDLETREDMAAMVEDMVAMVEDMVVVVAVAVEGEDPLWRQGAIPDLVVEDSLLLDRVERGEIISHLTWNQEDKELSKSRLSGPGFPWRNQGGRVYYGS